MNDKHTPILVCTNQSWKYFVSMLLDLVGTILGILSFFYMSNAQPHLGFLMAALFIFGLGILIKHLIKCPKCSSHWYWRSLKKPISEKAVVKVRLQTKCEQCGLTCENCT